MTAFRPKGGSPRAAKPQARKTAGRPSTGRPPAERPSASRASARPAAKAPAKATPRPAAKPRSTGRETGRDTGLERLQKILAHAGIASRRACEQLILEGHVHVNGEVVTELGAKANPLRDEITVDHRPIQKESPVYVLVNKPKGYVTTVKDDQGRPTVMALVQGIDARLYPVGRLDFNSEGLLLLTNDGAVAERLTSPDHELPKVYLVKVHRALTPEQLDELRGGFRLDGRKLKPCLIEVMDKQQNPWLKVTLTEGKNRQIRRMFEAIGHPVHKLKRIQFGPIADPLLKPGGWRFLHPNEIAALRAL